jgi:hypothetical protein
MRKLIYLIFGVAFISTFSCKKEIKNCCVLPIPQAKLTAERNNTLYETPDVHGIIRNDSITFTFAGQADVTSSDFTLDSLFIKLKYNGAGTYSLANADAAYFTIISDIHPAPANSPTTDYQLNPLYNNTLIITGYDQTSGKLTGTFNVEFLNSTSAAVNFLNGNFYLPVSD